MPNDNEHPRYTDPEHPYSGSGRRYQNNYNRDEYHAGDGPFQFPWWAIVIAFVVGWPLGGLYLHWPEQRHEKRQARRVGAESP